MRCPVLPCAALCCVPHLAKASIAAPDRTVTCDGDNTALHGAEDPLRLILVDDDRPSGEGTCEMDSDGDSKARGEQRLSPPCAESLGAPSGTGPRDSAGPAGPKEGNV